MKNTPINNAYMVLGLDLTTSEKEINKRAKDILNHLKIDDIPEYDNDLDLFENIRTEESVKEAVQNLQSPKRLLVDYFYWFQIYDDIDKDALKFVKNKEFQLAIETWGNDFKEETISSLMHKKNLAVLLLCLIYIENRKDLLNKSLLLWKTIIDSDKYWSSFKKMYSLHSEEKLDEKMLSDLKIDAKKYLANLYTEFYERYKDKNYVEKFQATFSIKSEKIQKVVMDPVFEKINNAVEELEKINVGEDGVMDSDEILKIKKLTSNIQGELNNLIDLGLYDDSQTKVMSDKAANALRTIVLDLHNNLNEFEKSSKLMEIAVQIAGTESLRNKLQNELDQINKNVTDDADDSLVIDIPGTFGGGTVIFKKSFIEYNGKKILYKNITAISYHSVNQSVNLIPVSQSYNYMVESESDRISFSFGTTLFIGNKEKKDVWIKLAGVSMSIIQPFIVEKLIKRIYDNNETINIGGVEFTKDGYSKSKFFGGRENVLWSDKIFTPTLGAGVITLWKDNGRGEGAEFKTVAMSVPNAVVIPELITACYNHV